MLASSGKFLAAHRGTTNIGITGSGIIDGGGKRELYLWEQLAAD